ncbi:M1 family metallopeptidase [Psychrobium sp. 1_MG-2023]|uniref:M1 family metallopeptidase n=1 Tax=Psychrobium sp. 1_MG-2023 TaxID=3062624 RepID=UPI000C32B3A0|nr:M1 family metallopeptidase [Psychrobium sp. 1_MG-2023]MDP2559771.1 M1 family metallopeptidase [Psychrobium sp. 1_MG-2023]PKF59121.1 peptidase M1 [Alteromonadales bacterium alter-6D02]
MRKTIALIVACSLVLLVSPSALTAHEHTPPITAQENLRGSITPERAWWDVHHYHLTVKVEPETKTINGTNVMTYQVIGQQRALQIELQPPMHLYKVTQQDKTLAVQQQGDSYLITLLEQQHVGKEYQLTMHFGGQPKEAIKPPWDGGITWQQDNNELPFIASANQGIGASIWWPNKDHPYDEPDHGVLISTEVPKHLMSVSNGRLVGIDNHPKRQTKTYHWQVTNPINNYGVNINIGDYVHFGDTYQGEHGRLDMNYYVLRDNLSKAQQQFVQAKLTIEAFEYWFGPYPFYQDSYKIVEVPYLGMEHQSSVTYGNGYNNGYKGRDLSQTGWGMKFDFIIVHETGHEWFANSLTNKDVADLWIHESFTNYSESLFLEYHYSKQAAAEYIRGMRAGISNKTPIVGVYNANRKGSGDMYNKGGNMLHTIRQIIDDDKKWRDILRGLNQHFYHQTVTSQQIEAYMIEHSGKDLSKVFDQYLRDYRIPTLEYFVQDRLIKVRWSNVISGFNMPVRVTIDGKVQWITPTVTWTKIKTESDKPSFSVDPDFYIASLNILGN